MTIQNANKLIKDINSKRKSWDERSSFEMKGVRNLSPADLDQIELYAETYVNSGGFGFTGLMDPLGEVAEVLNAYGLKSNSLF